MSEPCVIGTSWWVRTLPAWADHDWLTWLMATSMTISIVLIVVGTVMMIKYLYSVVGDVALLVGVFMLIVVTSVAELAHFQTYNVLWTCVVG